MRNENIHSVTIGESIVKALKEGKQLPSTCYCFEIIFNNQMRKSDVVGFLELAISNLEDVGIKEMDEIPLFENFEKKIPDMLEHVKREEWWFLLSDLLDIETFYL